MLQPTKPPSLNGRSSAAQFLEEHDVLTKEVASLTAHNSSLISQNTGLLAEVTMLRDELERSDRDRVKLQGFAASLATRLSVIQETISVALTDAAAYKIKPEEKQQAVPKVEERPVPPLEPADARYYIVPEVASGVSRLPTNTLMT